MKKKEIEGFAGCYVTSGGKVFGPNGEKTPRLNSTGYLSVILRQGIHRKELLLGRLVLESFIGTKGRAFQPEYIDGDKTNCHLDNLRWVKKNQSRISNKKLELLALDLVSLETIEISLEEITFLTSVAKAHIKKNLPKRKHYRCQGIYLIEKNRWEKDKLNCILPDGFILVDSLLNQYATNIKGELFSVLIQRKLALDNQYGDYYKIKSKVGDCTRIKVSELKEYYAVKSKTLSKESN